MINPIIYLQANNITFTGDMIPAIFEGLKTQTRRPVKKEVPTTPEGDLLFSWREKPELHSAYGKPGDLLWVQEGYHVGRVGYKNITGTYTADGKIFFQQRLTKDEWEKFSNRKYPYRKSPGRFMYKSLCRLVIEIEAVEFERVQDITAQDVWNEGVRLELDDRVGGFKFMPKDLEPELYIEKFQKLWDSMYAGTEFAWANNPWVEVIKFKPVDLEALKKQLSKARSKKPEGVRV